MNTTKTEELAAPTARAIASTESNPAAKYRAYQEVANACRDMVLRCVVVIQERRYVRVEGWTTIAALCDCIAEIERVENVPGEGVKAIAILKRTTDLAILSRAEGFVGCDEPDWYGGTVKRWNRKKRPPVEETKTLERRSDHAIRAMAQTRAISRVLRGPFSFVITMIDEGLSTVPAEEITTAAEDLEDDDRKPATAGATGGGTITPGAGGGTTGPTESGGGSVPRSPEIALRDQFRQGKWRDSVIHFGEKKGTRIGDVALKNLRWWVDEWRPRPFGDKPIPEIDWLLRAAFDVAGEEEAKELEKFRH